MACQADVVDHEIAPIFRIQNFKIMYILGSLFH